MTSKVVFVPDLKIEFWPALKSLGSQVEVWREGGTYVCVLYTGTACDMHVLCVQVCVGMLRMDVCTRVFVYVCVCGCERNNESEKYCIDTGCGCHGYQSYYKLGTIKWFTSVGLRT